MHSVFDFIWLTFLMDNLASAIHISLFHRRKASKLIFNRLYGFRVSILLMSSVYFYPFVDIYCTTNSAVVLSFKNVHSRQSSESGE